MMSSPANRSLFPTCWPWYPITPNAASAIFPVHNSLPFLNSFATSAMPWLQNWQNVSSYSKNKDVYLSSSHLNSTFPTNGSEENGAKLSRLTRRQQNDGRCPICDFNASCPQELTEHLSKELNDIENRFQSFKSKTVGTFTSITESNADEKLAVCYENVCYQNRRNILQNIKCRRVERSRAKPYTTLRQFKHEESNSSPSVPKTDIEIFSLDVEPEMKNVSKICDKCSKVGGISFVSLVCKHIFCLNCYSSNKIILNKSCPVCECSNNAVDETA